MTRVMREPAFLRCGKLEIPSFLAIEPTPQRLAARVNDLELCTFDGEFHVDEEGTRRVRARLIAACPDIIGQIVVHAPPGYKPTLFLKTVLAGKLGFEPCAHPTRIENGYIVGERVFERYAQLTGDRRRPTPHMPWPALAKAYRPSLTIYPLD